MDSYNENRTPDQPIQLVLDFTADVAEAEALEAKQRQSGLIDATEQQQPSVQSRDTVPV